MRSRIGILGAMAEEVELLLNDLTERETVVHGMRAYHTGRIAGIDAVIAFSRWGKVAAATTATEMVSRFGVRELIFTGVAGAIDPRLNVGDVVVARELIQHDLDARPIFERHEIPLLGRARLAADPECADGLQRAAQRFAQEALSAPAIYAGLIASGDQFFASAERVRELRHRLPDVLCVEMEGAAVAQVCEEYGVRLGIARVISDSADEGAPHDFAQFVRDVARVRTHGVVREFLRSRSGRG